MNAMRRPVLQLNASYEALRNIPAMRASKLAAMARPSPDARFNSSMRHSLEYLVRPSSGLPLAQI